MYDERLIRKINYGKAFALIGSGPSSEMGYPSWPSLAKEVTEELRYRKQLSDEASYAKYLSEKKYPELFSQAQIDSGGRNQLVEMISQLLKAPAKKRGNVYEVLSNWPFACYLTTNWDDEINHHLKARKTYFSTIGNSKEELSQIRSDTRNLIVKLHSDLFHPADAVITADDYSALHTQKYTYLRDRLRSIFEMFDVVIVGHSLTDPDLNLVLQVAKETAHPEHPVFFIAADLTQAEIRDYLNRYNIVAITYPNSDETHSQLRRTLSLFDRFIVPRQRRLDLKLAEYTPAELEAAQALAVYRRLAIGGQSEFNQTQYIAPLVLRALDEKSAPIALDQLLKTVPLSSACATDNVKLQVPPVLQELQSKALVLEEKDGFSLTEKGLQEAKAISVTHKQELDQAYGQFKLELKTRYQQITNAESSSLVRNLENTFVQVFKQRGLSIANAVLSGQSLAQGALSDVFSAISNEAAKLQPASLGIAFMEAAQEFLLSPTDAQRQYLASLSQGYFLYHLFGLDPTCARIRGDVLKSTIWWCDSNTLIPLLAKGCANNDYAVDLFIRLRNTGAHTVTTGRLVEEVFRHLEWTVNFIAREGLQSVTMLEAATQVAGYKQNLFLDGYINQTVEGKVRTFVEYLEQIVPNGVSQTEIQDGLNKLGITIVNPQALQGFRLEDNRAIFELMQDIKDHREKNATFRSMLQVEAEGEILHMVRMLREGKYKLSFSDLQYEHIYFLS